MNRMTPEEIRDLMNAVIADPSAEIQWSRLGGSGERHDLAANLTEHFGFDFTAFRYHIKPKQGVIWVNEVKSAVDPKILVLHAYETKTDAIHDNSYLCGWQKKRVAVRYVEQPE